MKGMVMTAASPSSLAGFGGSSCCTHIRTAKRKQARDSLYPGYKQRLKGLARRKLLGSLVSTSQQSLSCYTATQTRRYTRPEAPNYPQCHFRHYLVCEELADQWPNSIMVQKRKTHELRLSMGVFYY
ncbi:hypothetical protein CFIMG_005104RAa [Ceratocystis fimbriata CBS 114723]|uniref:Uncharacterized protein n=1 Tax=Ceratocystis fimbriata CBS 114723 TaxID=1035309 RepID=A0A2C5WG27_9PEZI|nr:hypothetical protein CFIMG_005104RAa [Ceratocystis fimbriata CBS 114723]